jgi:hypothetical protein
LILKDKGRRALLSNLRSWPPGASVVGQGT